MCFYRKRDTYYVQSEQRRIRSYSYQSCYIPGGLWWCSSCRCRPPFAWGGSWGGRTPAASPRPAAGRPSLQNMEWNTFRISHGILTPGLSFFCPNYVTFIITKSTEQSRINGSEHPTTQPCPFISRLGWRLGNLDLIVGWLDNWPVWMVLRQ